MRQRTLKMNVAFRTRRLHHRELEGSGKSTRFVILQLKKKGNIAFWWGKSILWGVLGILFTMVVINYFLDSI